MSSYKNQLDSILKSINSASYNYDPDTDKAYLDYLNRLKVQGGAAASDTIAKIASSTGGITSSYGAAAASSVANEYAKKGAEAVLDFRENARKDYDNDMDFMLDYASLLKSLEKAATPSYRVSSSGSSSSSVSGDKAGPDKVKNSLYDAATDVYNEIYSDYMKDNRGSRRSTKELEAAAHTLAMSAYRRVLLGGNQELTNGGGSFGLYSTYYEE